MKPRFFEDWRFYSIMGFYLAQCGYTFSGWTPGLSDMLCLTLFLISTLWVITTLFAWKKEIFSGRIKFIALTMILSPLLLILLLTIDFYFDCLNDFIFFLFLYCYPILYSVFIFFYGKLRHTPFTLFESFLLGIICIPVLPTFMCMYIVIYLSFLC